MPSTTEAGVRERLEALEPHEAVAVLWELHGELADAAGELHARLEQHSFYVEAVLARLDEKSERAGSRFFVDSNPENEAYLAELVARVKGTDG
jgi:hypothetical protein